MSYLTIFVMAVSVIANVLLVIYLILGKFNKSALVQSLTTQHLHEVEKLKELHKSAFEKLSLTYSEKEKSLSVKHREAMDREKANHLAELNRLNQKHLQDMNAKDQAIAHLKMANPFNRRMEAELEEVQKESAAAQEVMSQLLDEMSAVVASAKESMAPQPVDPSELAGLTATSADSKKNQAA